MTWSQEVDYWDRSQLNPIYSRAIVFITLNLGSASALGNKNNITLALGFNYNLMHIILN